MPGSLSARNNAYSLLHELLGQEKDVGLLRFIKSEQPVTKQLVKKIGATCGTNAKLLEKFAKDDPTLRLDDVRLPPAEVAVRESISTDRRKQLLSQTGATFDLTLLLTQVEALGYAAHLAKISEQFELKPDRRRELAMMNAGLKNLEAEVFSLLLAKPK